jgi:hypothetical protein
VHEVRQPIGPEALGRNTFLAFCTYLALLLASAALALLTEGTALGAFVEFDDFYLLVVIVESFFGIFVLPFVMPFSSNARSSLTDHIILYCAGAPFVVVSAFAASTPVSGVLASQILVFCIWSVAAGTEELLRKKSAQDARVAQGRQSGELYMPMWALFFFGLLIAGKALASFLNTAGAISTFSVPIVVASWSSGRFFDANGWVGVGVCLGALAWWSRKFYLDTEQ